MRNSNILSRGGVKEVRNDELESFFHKIRAIVAIRCGSKHTCNSVHSRLLGARRFLRPVNVESLIESIVDKLLNHGVLGATLICESVALMVVACWCYFTFLHSVSWELRCIGMWALIIGLAAGTAKYNPEGRAG
jgi:hypothetical protein